MASLFNAALPASIQSRIPKIPLIRRTVSIQAAIFRSDSALAPAASPIRPPSPADDDVALDESLDRTLRAAALTESRISVETTARSRGNSLDLVLAGSGRERTASEVNWKYGLNGYRTLESALREAGDPDRLPELERQIYVESVTYLLRGLPGDLSHGELHQLRRAAPGAVMDEPQQLLYRRLEPQEQQQHQELQSPYPSKSLPHAVTHWLVTRLYALLVFVLPLATSFVQLAVELDRKYRLPEALLAWGMSLLWVLYRNATVLAAAVCGVGDGRLGRALDEGSAYVAAGVVSGFREAVSDVARERARG